MHRDSYGTCSRSGSRCRLENINLCALASVIAFLAGALGPISGESKGLMQIVGKSNAIGAKGSWNHVGLGGKCGVMGNVIKSCSGELGQRQFERERSTDGPWLLGQSDVPETVVSNKTAERMKTEAKGSPRVTYCMVIS
jgi:hypothetical protein